MAIEKCNPTMAIYIKERCSLGQIEMATADPDHSDGKKSVAAHIVLEEGFYQANGCALPLRSNEP